MRPNFEAVMTVQHRGPMRGIDALTEKEKQTLRLIVRGHDAKSLARHLGLSVHTINERLRDARRKLDVSSSREAARRLADTESSDPKNLGDGLFGDAASDPGVEQAGVQGPSGGASMLHPWPIAGVCLMIALIALAVLSASGPASTPPATANTVAAEASAADAARRFLELGDQSRWSDAYAATGTSFRQLNTLKLWSDVSVKVRVPLGPLVSRTMLSQESVPTPPAGAEIVKFRSSFANKAGVTETVSLANEGGQWKVTGIYLD